MVQCPFFAQWTALCSFHLLSVSACDNHLSISDSCRICTHWRGRKGGRERGGKIVKMHGWLEFYANCIISFSLSFSISNNNIPKYTVLLYCVIIIIADPRLHHEEVGEHAIHSVRREAVCACEDGVH